ncbi:MAG TPA: ATP-binding cassette domain-containing protein [Burkholderiales bacterium]
MAEMRQVSGDSILPLRLEEVSFVAGGKTIIDRISLTIEAGPRTIILGPNGAGKSVLMRLCHGLLEPTSGRVVWNRPERRGEPRRQAMVFQRQVMLRRSALANITYALKLAGVPRRERERRACEALERVGLAHLAKHSARVLSGGEQQRLALARAWALRPEVLFLDEPTASLDPGATAEVERIIEAIHAAGTKILMSTHNLGQARRLGDEVVFLSAGRIKERAPVDDFFTAPASAEAEAFLKGELPWLYHDVASPISSPLRLRR